MRPVGSPSPTISGRFQGAVVRLPRMVVLALEGPLLARKLIAPFVATQCCLMLCGIQLVQDIGSLTNHARHSLTHLIHELPTLAQAVQELIHRLPKATFLDTQCVFALLYLYTTRTIGAGSGILRLSPLLQAHVICLSSPPQRHPLMRRHSLLSGP